MYTQFDTSQFAFASDSSDGIAEHNPRQDKGRWQALYRLERYDGVDIDEYRDKYGKEEGERRFFEEFAPSEVWSGRENLLVFGGASTLWECLVGNGTATGAQTLTFFNNANTYIGVGDSTTTEAYTQTDLQAASNKVRNAADTSYPLHTDGTTGKTITAATNASPISVTATAHGYSTGDFVSITGVVGNTAANGVWQITVVDVNTFTLNGSTGNGAYTSGGLASKANVLVVKSTFGTGTGNFAWQEWGIFNGSSGGRMLNRKVSSLGTKTSSATWAFTVAIALT